jgi:hypothetical protein
LVVAQQVRSEANCAGGSLTRLSLGKALPPSPLPFPSPPLSGRDAACVSALPRTCLSESRQVQETHAMRLYSLACTKTPRRALSFDEIDPKRDLSIANDNNLCNKGVRVD